MSGRGSFIDTNIWLYAFSKQPSTERKSIIAASLTQRTDIVVSTQVINEVSVNFLRKLGGSEEQVRGLIRSFYYQHHVVGLDFEQFVQASTLRDSFSLSYWDSLIVAGAVAAGATTLYTEDMQNGLRFPSGLLVVNPFV